MSSRPNVERRFAAYREVVDLVAAPQSEQIRWMDQTGSSAEEIRLCLLDTVQISHGPGLVEHGVVTAEMSNAVEAVIDEAVSWRDVSLWAEDDALARPEWVHLRSTARHASDVLDAGWRKWSAQKTTVSTDDQADR